MKPVFEPKASAFQVNLPLMQGRRSFVLRPNLWLEQSTAELRAHILLCLRIFGQVYRIILLLFLCLNIFIIKNKKNKGGDPAAGSPTATL